MEIGHKIYFCDLLSEWMEKYIENKLDQFRFTVIDSLTIDDCTIYRIVVEN
jgi:hypothetical protein